MTLTDIAIVGAGPAGLAFARSLRSGLKVTLIERQRRAALDDPAYDGREIALTQRSIALLRDLGAWDRIGSYAVWPLQAARVQNGASPFALMFAPEPSGGDAPGELGALVSNHHLRRALFSTIDQQPDLTLLTETHAVEVGREPRGYRLALSDGTTLRTRLLVVADSRFSTTRDQLGVGVDMTRLGRSMLVCRMSHTIDHGHVATEWFDHGQTLATLPLSPGQSSLILTLAAPEIDRLAALSDAAFKAEMTRRCRGRLGQLSLAGSRHVYPLVTTWARQFSGRGFALIGDAAVGMHPVTAHGFNLGLRGQDSLARIILAARAKGRDIGAAETLEPYQRDHRQACWPLYTATNLTARLYATETAPARLARHALLRLGQGVGPARRLVTRSLMAT